MILLFTETIDYSSKIFLEWLVFYKVPFEVFYETDFVELEYNFNQNEADFNVFKNGKILCNKSQISGVWSRRSSPKFKSLSNSNSETETNYNVGHLVTRSESAYRTLEQCFSLGKFDKGNFNKIEFIKCCIDLSIPIPKTLITESKDSLLKFINECGEVIVKSIAATYSAPSIEDKNIWKLGFTTLIQDELLNHIPPTFQLSMFQEKLNKSYEVRVFYLDGKCFSQAIFSQTKVESEIDYRLGYGFSMRQSPYQLPSKIEQQVDKLMEYIGLKTGSLDIVVTTENKFVFLEVNPVGQFGNVSMISNYSLEKEIADWFIKNTQHG